MNVLPVACCLRAVLTPTDHTAQLSKIVRRHRCVEDHVARGLLAIGQRKTNLKYLAPISGCVIFRAPNMGAHNCLRHRPHWGQYVCSLFFPLVASRRMNFLYHQRKFTCVAPVWHSRCTWLTLHLHCTRVALALHFRCTCVALALHLRALTSHWRCSCVSLTSH